MSNPALGRRAEFSNRTLSAKELEKLYNAPAATQQNNQQEAQLTAAQVIGGSANPMTIENTIQKTAILFAVLLGTAAVGWFMPGLALPGALGALALGLVIAFKKKVSVGLIIAHAALEGLFIGGISSILEGAYGGIVSQAIMATLVVFAVTLVLFRNGKLRATPKLTKMFFIATIGYAAFALINLALMLTGVASDPWGLRGVQIGGIPLGAIIGVLAILLATYSLVMDFDFIAQGAKNQLPQEYAWLGGHGLLVTLVWLYIEFLRLFAIMRGGD